MYFSLFFIGNLPPSPEELEMSIDGRSSGGSDNPHSQTHTASSPHNINAGPPPSVGRPCPLPRQSANIQTVGVSDDTDDFVMVPATLPSEPEPSRIPQGCVAF